MAELEKMSRHPRQIEEIAGMLTDVAKAKFEELKAENARLRAALKELAESADNDTGARFSKRTINAIAAARAHEQRES